MDETQKIKEMLKKELTRWNSTKLSYALRYCEERANETANVYWMDLERTIRAELDAREGKV